MEDIGPGAFDGIEDRFLSYKTIQERKAAILQAMLKDNKTKSFRFFRRGADARKTFEDVLPILKKSLMSIEPTMMAWADAKIRQDQDEIYDWEHMVLSFPIRNVFYD